MYNINEEIKRIVCALLTLALTFSMVGCGDDKGESDYDPDQRLEVIVEPIEYSDEFIKKAEERFTSVTLKFLDAYYGVSPDDEQKGKIKAAFKEAALPMLYEVRIYENELDGLFTKVENYLASTEDSDTLSAIASVYEQALHILGSD